MKKAISIAALMLALSVAVAPVALASGMFQRTIVQGQHIDAVIETVGGDRVVMITTQPAFSHDRKILIRPNEPIIATVQPKKPGNDRVALCVTLIRYPGMVRLINVRGPKYPHEGCLGQVAEPAGQNGLPVRSIVPGQRVRVVLNGDLVLEAE